MHQRAGETYILRFTCIETKIYGVIELFFNLQVFMIYSAFVFYKLVHACLFYFLQVDEVTDLLASFTSLSLQKQNLGDR